MVVGFGLSAGALLAVTPHPTVAVVVAVSVIMALVTFAGVYLHRSSMLPLYVDLESALDRTGDREVTGDTEPQTAPSDSVVHHRVDRPVTRHEGRQLSAWTGGRGFVPRVATTGLMALAIAGVVKGTYLPLLVVAMLLLTIIAGVIFPAIWSRDDDRRGSAARLVRLVLAPELDDPTRREAGALRKLAAPQGRRRSRSERSSDEPPDKPSLSR
jgi:hypothetical protein